jgi:hypothetical protein
MTADTRIQPHPIDNRAFWDPVRTDPRFAPVRNLLLPRAEGAGLQPPPVPAADFLAARRSNDRGRLDRVWQEDRATLTALAFRRCLLGVDPTDPDDTLLNWLWALLTLPTWVVSAHLPGNDLPDLAQPQFDLAACEMAALLAELRQALKPWMDSVSKTLADSIVTEIDRRVLRPFAEGAEVWWDNPTHQINNWTGVCAGSILAACESLASQGHPRPQARTRALKGLNLFLAQAFTAAGECDEGVGYWSYGVGMACLGWSRLAPADFAAATDSARFQVVAEYPRRAHLFGDCFFTANDGGLHASAGVSFVPWLARACGSDWLARWARRSPALDCRHFGQLVSILWALDRGLASAAPDPSSALPPPPPSQWFPDQQAAVIRIASGPTLLLLTLSGGDNAERHNHNDLGHFMAALDGRWIIPDLGAPHYSTDFFGPRRYRYLSASSRGHCCPLVAGQEQRPGPEAAGRVVRWDPDAAHPTLELDLTAAYPAEAHLRQWIRQLARAGDRAVLTDTFHTSAGGVPITQVLWSLPKPVVDSNSILRLGPLVAALSPHPLALRVTAVNPADHALRDYRDPLYRVEADYATDAQGRLATRLKFSAA